jgi:hypothetical protein
VWILSIYPRVREAFLPHLSVPSRKRAELVFLYIFCIFLSILSIFVYFVYFCLCFFVFGISPILHLTFECAWSISPRIRRVFSSPATIIYRNILYTRATSFSRKKRAIHAGILKFPIFRSKIPCVHIGYRGLNCGTYTAHSQFPSPVARSVGHSARLCTMFGHFVRMHFREIDGGAVDREIRPASHGPMGGWPDGHIHSFPAPWRGPLVIPRGSARCSDTL